MRRDWLKTFGSCLEGGDGNLQCTGELKVVVMDYILDMC